MLKYMITFCAMVALGACAAPKAGLEKDAPLLRVTQLEVERELTADIPYAATLRYTVVGAGGKVSINQACFTWSGEGPYCFPVRTQHGDATSTLRTRNPGVYYLKGFLEYTSNGYSKRSNVSAASRIEVK